MDIEGRDALAPAETLRGIGEGAQGARLQTHAGNRHQRHGQRGDQEREHDRPAPDARQAHDRIHMQPTLPRDGHAQRHNAEPRTQRPGGAPRAAAQPGKILAAALWAAAVPQAVGIDMHGRRSAADPMEPPREQAREPLLCRRHLVWLGRVGGDPGAGPAGCEGTGEPIGLLLRHGFDQAGERHRLAERLSADDAGDHSVVLVLQHDDKQHLRQGQRRDEEQHEPPGQALGPQKAQQQVRPPAHASTSTGAAKT